MSNALKYKVKYEHNTRAAICQAVGQLQDVNIGYGASVGELAKCFKVSKPTMQKILNRCVTDGVLNVMEITYRKNAIMRYYTLGKLKYDAYVLGMYRKTFELVTDAITSEDWRCVARAMTHVAPMVSQNTIEKTRQRIFREELEEGKVFRLEL